MFLSLVLALPRSLLPLAPSRYVPACSRSGASSNSHRRNNSVLGLPPRAQHLGQHFRYVCLCGIPVTRQVSNVGFQTFVNSRATLASATIAVVGSVAWYTHLYGTLPFIGEVHANAPEEEGLHSPHFPWSHSGWFDSFDHARYVSVYACIPLFLCSFAAL